MALYPVKYLAAKCNTDIHGYLQDQKAFYLVL